MSLPEARQIEISSTVQWNELHDALEKKRHEIRLRAIEKFGKARGNLWFLNKISQFGKKIEEKIGDDRFRFVAWHVLSGSTGMDKDTAPELDVPGELSVAAFLESLDLELTQ